MNAAEIAFDKYAANYDASFTETCIGKLQRKRVWRYLEKNISSTTHPELLELNCGTGTDAEWLCRKGFLVTATDSSSGMIRAAEQKLKSENIKIIQCDIRNVPKKFSGKKFDIIFSDFGGMNCLDPDSIQDAAEKMNDLLNGSGRLVMVIMGRNCKWEQFYFKRKKDMKNAYRRRNANAVEADIAGSKVATWYYSPEEIKKYFGKYFTVRNCKPIGIAIPPSYTRNYFQQHSFYLEMLNAAESILGKFSRLSDKADHYLIDLVRK
ncbi:MAG: class I SAM-dependent methyltransferase [Bacteroidetes bacterium]|nr:class I SAM-dependent methyltransferase [Bacteroidota bacterium]